MYGRLLGFVTFVAVSLQVTVGVAFFGALSLIVLTSFSVIPQPQS